MKDKLRKAFLFGIGAMAATGEKIDDLIDELIAKGEVTSDEGKKIMDEWKEKVKANQRELGDRIKEEINKVISKLDLATKKDIEELRARLDAIEQKLNEKI